MKPSKLRQHLDESAATDLLKRAVAIPSITGNEADFAEFLERELRSHGASQVERREFAPGRPNVWGAYEGAGDGNNLMLIGHTDTVRADGWKERWAGTEREDPFGGAIVDGYIWGRGTGDLKAGICTALAAVRLLDRAGIQLAGNVQLVFVGDEESGEQDMGVSAGMKTLVPLLESGALPRPDFAIYVEPSNLEVYTAQMGFFIADIEIIGKSAYFGVPELGTDALKAAHAVMKSLWAHSDDLAGRGEHGLVGRSFLLLSEVSAGGYIAVPGQAQISLIRKLRPGEDLDRAAEEFENVVRATSVDPGIEIEIRFTAGRDVAYGGTPTEVDPQHEAVTKLIAAVNATAPGRAHVTGAPFWSEAPFLTKLGIPTVYFAPGDIRNCHTLEERVNLEDYLSGIIALAVFMANYCGVVSNPHKGIREELQA